jgi:hypothetical protein
VALQRAVILETTGPQTLLSSPHPSALDASGTIQVPAIKRRSGGPMG